MPAAAPLGRSARWRILTYLSFLMALVAIGAPGGEVIGIPLRFVLKNKLHMTAPQMAEFRLFAAIPTYLCCVFGFARDIWNPLGRGDRGFMMLFGGLGAALYIVFAFLPVSTATIFAATVLLTSAALFVASAQQGLTATLGQQHEMSGQVSVVFNVFGALLGMATALLGGAVSDRLEALAPQDAARALFLLGALFMAFVAAYGAWRPPVVFDNLRSERAADLHPWRDLKRLAAHWPIYPAMLIWLLWNFAPGSSTPLQYFLQNDLHAKDAVWGQWNAIFSGAFVPTFLLFGALCQRFTLGKLLVWGTVFAIPQMVPLLFIHSATGALVVAVPMGLMGGVASAAYFDLIIRSCPRGLQGTTLMLSASLASVIVHFGDVLGTELYSRYGGFAACVAAITAVYALILPALLLVPRRLLGGMDEGRPTPAPAE
ncbi:MAG TPA: MFS transporter [Stellaceae bacterium]|nr:MFS transporter [Stellaceae bacterium]